MKGSYYIMYSLRYEWSSKAASVTKLVYDADTDLMWQEPE